jgi:hypothetical protein
MTEEVNYRSAIKDFLGRPIPPDGDLRVWLDDDPVDRKAPEGWVHVRSVREACFLLLTGRVVELSLDNDLNNACAQDGDSEEEITKKSQQADDNLFGTGYQVVDFLEEQQHAGNSLWPRDGVVLHTANPQGRDRMARGIEPVKRNPGLKVTEEKTNGGKPRFIVESGTQDEE